MWEILRPVLKVGVKLLGLLTTNWLVSAIETENTIYETELYL